MRATGFIHPVVQQLHTSNNELDGVLALQVQSMKRKGRQIRPESFTLPEVRIKLFNHTSYLGRPTNNTPSELASCSHTCNKVYTHILQQRCIPEVV